MADVADVTDSTEKQGESNESEASDKATKRRPNLPSITGGAFTIPPQDLYDYTKKLTERDWAHIEGYVFRLRPRILRLPPQEKNIGFVSGAVTEKWFLENFGSGKFQVRLNDTDRSNKKGICESFIDLDDPDYPPKYDLRELDIAHRENRQLVEHLKRTGKLTAEGDIVVQKQAENADATAATALRDVALEAMRGRQEKPDSGIMALTLKQIEMAEKRAELAEARAAEERKAAEAEKQRQHEKDMELAEKRAADIGKSSADSGIMTLMMKQIEMAEKRAELAEQRAAEERKSAEADKQRQHEKDMELIKQRATATDPMDMIDKVLGIKERLGGEEPKHQNWKEKLVDEGMQHVPQLLELAGRAISYQRGPAVQQQPRPQQQQPVQQQQPAVQQQPQPAPGAEPMPQQTPPLDPEIAFLLPIFEVQGQMLVVAFRNDPSSGPDIARQVELFAGAAVYERIARMGKEKILATIALLPQMAKDLAAVGTPEMLNDFIEDFINPPSGDEDDNPPEPPAATPIASGRKKKVSE